MQHRYVPDVGDLGKLGLISALATGEAGSETLSVGLVWYLTEPELDPAGNFANRDGRHVGYLQLGAPKANRYRACAPGLYDQLVGILFTEFRERTGRHRGPAGYFCWLRRKASPSVIPKPVALRAVSFM